MSLNQSSGSIRTCTVLVKYTPTSTNQLLYRHWSKAHREAKLAQQAWSEATSRAFGLLSLCAVVKSWTQTTIPGADANSFETPCAKLSGSTTVARSLSLSTTKSKAKSEALS